MLGKIEKDILSARHDCWNVLSVAQRNKRTRRRNAEGGGEVKDYKRLTKRIAASNMGRIVLEKIFEKPRANA